MLDREISASGIGNVQAFGNGNTINNNVFMPSGHLPLEKSVIYELLQIVLDAEGPVSDDFPMADPAYINDKLQYNNAPRYIRKIENHFDDFIRVSEVIRGFPDSESIVKRLRDMYIDEADVLSDGTIIVGNGDVQLERIREKLKQIILNDRNAFNESITIEHVDQFCIALMAYCIHECKVLLNPCDQ